MKNIFLILTIFGIIGCSQDDYTPIEYTLSAELSGQCTDLEPPSSFKEISTYEVEGFYGIRQCEEFCDSYGFVYVTEEEESRRDEAGLEVLLSADFLNLSIYEGYKYYQLGDTPFVEIYSISEEIFLQDNWQVDAYHSYIGGENEGDNLYGMNKAQCSLNVIERKGVITEDIRNKIDWCFDFECFSDRIMKSRAPSKTKTLEDYVEENL